MTNIEVPPTKGERNQQDENGSGLELRDEGRMDDGEKVPLGDE